MGFERKTVIRAPRPAELALLEQLARKGPSAVLHGPLGRCLKRGWCAVAPRTDEAADDTGMANPVRARRNAATPSVLFTITLAGLQALRDAKPTGSGAVQNARQSARDGGRRGASISGEPTKASDQP
jgi:hypothetical protein